MTSTDETTLPAADPHAAADTHARYDAGLPVWWPTHRVWLWRNRWYTSEPGHRYIQPGGFGPKIVDGLPVDDDTNAAHDLAAKILGGSSE